MLKNWRDIDANRRGRCRIITKVLFAYIEVGLTFKLKGGYNQNRSDWLDLSVVLNFNLKGLYNIKPIKKTTHLVVLTFNLKGLYNLCAVKP